MLKYLTPLDWILWILITLTQIYLLQLSRGIFKFFRFAMIYLLAQSFCQLLFMVFSTSYKEIYYVTAIIECLILAGVSIELSSLLVPKFKNLIQKIGPLVIAIPTFVIYAIVSSSDFGQDSLTVKAIRIAELSFISSLSLIFGSIAFEDKNSTAKEMSRSYIALLVLLIFCTELQVRTGITSFVRILWPLSWLIGLLQMLGSLRRCRNTGEWKIKSLEGQTR